MQQIGLEEDVRCKLEPFLNEEAKRQSNESSFVFSRDHRGIRCTYMVESHYVAYKDDLKSSKSQNNKLKRIEEFESPYIFQWNNTNDKEDHSYNDDIKEKRDRWIESLKKDIYVNEAMNLLRDLTSIKSNEILSQINID